MACWHQEIALVNETSDFLSVDGRRKTRQSVGNFIEAIPLCVNTISIYIYVIHKN